jgi:hypothetical protein
VRLAQRARECVLHHEDAERHLQRDEDQRDAQRRGGAPQRARDEEHGRDCEDGERRPEEAVEHVHRLRRGRSEKGVAAAG